MSLIDSPHQLGDAFSHLRNEKLLGFDCEGENLSRNGRICLIQVASRSQCFLFDVLTLSDVLFSSGLKEILESEKITKIVHDCRRDSDALFHQFGVTLKNVFDTQVFDLWMRKNLFLKVPKFVRSYSNLLSIYLNIDKDTLNSKAIGQKTMSNDSKIWAKRPLSEEMIDYAMIDVIHLHNLYDKMHEVMMLDLKAGFNKYLNVDRSKPVSAKEKIHENLEFITDSMKHLMKDNRGALSDPKLFHIEMKGSTK